MARNQLLNSLSYDPALYGIDDSFWKVITGTPAVASDKIRLTSAALKTYRTFRYGGYRMTVNVPVAPVAGQAKEWGIENAALGEAARFEIAEDVFKAVTVDKDGNSTTTPITWLAGWHTNDILYEIVWREDYVQFLVAGTIVATHEKADNRPIFPMNLYIVNGDADNLDLASLEVSESDMFNPANLINVELSEADIEIGAVELKDAATDTRCLIGAANVARNATDNVLIVQNIDAAGDVLTEATQVSIFGDTTTIAGDTTSMDAKMPALGTAAMAASVPFTLATDDTQFGAVGAAADVDGNIHGQLRYIGEAVDGLEATGFADEATFTLGTSEGTPVFGQYTAAGDNVTDGQTGVFAMTIDRHLLTETKGYDSGTDSQKVYEVSPTFQHVLPQTISATTQGNGTTTYYISAGTYPKWSLQIMNTDGGAGDNTYTLFATAQDDGTAAASCDYIDIAADYDAAGQWSTADANLDAMINESNGKGYKYLKVVVVRANDGGGTDGAWDIYFNGFYA